MESCGCEKCVSACRRDPGRLVPADVKRLAALLGVSEEGLKHEYLVIVPAKNSHVRFLAPAKIKAARFLAAPGTVVPGYYAEENGRCVFLTAEGTCRVHEAKPFECAAYMGCRHTFLGRPYKENDVEAFFISRWRKFQELTQT
ncbi:MAG TPA: YkgJ family cysteine cluster protein [Candidatus Aminicenantes bacterium]|nr:YkgJ family cysteine cluster protein [Candidatus Aminicenantes bacterium]